MVKILFRTVPPVLLKRSTEMCLPLWQSTSRKEEGEEFPLYFWARGMPFPVSLIRKETFSFHHLDSHTMTTTASQMVLASGKKQEKKRNRTDKKNPRNLPPATVSSWRSPIPSLLVKWELFFFQNFYYIYIYIYIYTESGKTVLKNLFTGH